VAAGPPPAVISSVVACRNITQAERRLRCYDDAAAALSSAVSSGNVIAMDKQAVVKTRKELFGFPVPRIPLFGSGNEPEQKALNATIRNVTPTGFMRFILTLDNGAKWTTTEPLTRQSDPRPGQKIEIKRSLMGNYMLSINGNPPAKARRVE
jgi:hypothetical protein